MADTTRSVLPAKLHRTHRWVAVTTAYLRRDEVEALVEERHVTEEAEPVGEVLTYDPDAGQIVDWRVVCIDCQLPFARNVGPCSVGPIEQRRQSNGRPRR